ncbi:hypothetical protein [Cryobacterium sp. M15]|uniref:hypothetical protein n=1 Tax=Cryobacterium sp. M15 TaxID=2048291 RepID=UPI000CE2E744|nr:hypothetical protein [Cryobacterium sp. M15]
MADLGLDCQFECTGIIDLAIEEHQGQWLHEESTDENTVCLDATAVQAAVASSTNLAGVRFRHKWAGAIDTSTWFCAFFGQARGGRISYAAGFTGLGGGAAHFAAGWYSISWLTAPRNALNWLWCGASTFVSAEPIASAGIQATRWALNRADHNRGKRNVLLTSFDARRLGFDS